MKRYPTFDPPEYRQWQCQPGALEEFRGTIARDPARREIVAGLTSHDLLGLYRGLLRTRLLDIALKRWVLQGVISKAWLGTGEEAVTVGSVHALTPGDVVGPMIRNEGVCVERGMPVADVFRAYLATADSGPRGRDLHHGSLPHGVISPISHVGALVPVMTGMALAFMLRREARVALTYVGDGSTRTGEFHEGVSLAASRRAPLVVVIQDNQVALGTRRERHTRASFEDLAAAYGVLGMACDGNNVLDTRAAAEQAIAHARGGGGPVILVARTFRMGGHATHDEDEARRLFTPEEFAHWGARDPIGLFEEHLLAGAPLEAGAAAASPEERREGNRLVLERIESEVVAEIDAGASAARESAASQMPDPATLGHDVISSVTPTP